MGQEIDGRADQYGLAATAYHLLTGTMPFQHSNPAVVISKQLANPAPLLSESHPALANLDRALSVALAKDPSRRYRRCLDLAEALRRESERRYSRPAVAPPDATRALSVSRPEHEAAPDANRSMNLPPLPGGGRSHQGHEASRSCAAVVRDSRRHKKDGSFAFPVPEGHDAS